MSNPIQPLGAQPAAETTPVAPVASEQQATLDHTATLESLAGPDLLKVINGEALETTAPTSTPPAPAATEATPAAAPTESAPVGEQPPVEAPPTPGEGSKSAKRVSFNGFPADQQQEIADARDLVRDGKAPDLLAALQTLRGTAPVATPPAEPSGEATPAATPVAPQASQEVTELEAVIADLSAQRDQADDDFDKPRVRELDAQIRAQERLLIKAELVAEQRQQSAVAYETAYDEAVTTLENRFPAVLDETSNFYRLLDAQVTAAKANNDPRLRNPDYLLGMAEELEGMLNPTPAQPGAIPPRTVREAGTRLGAELAPAHHSAPRPTKADTEALIKSASPDELLAVIGDR